MDVPLDKYLEHIVGSMPGVFYWKNIDGVYLGCNNFNMPGLEKAQSIIGKTDYDLYSKEEADKIREHDLSVMTLGKTLHVEEYITLPNGEKIQFVVDKIPLKDASGKIIGLIGTSLDITEIKEREKRERKALLEAAEATSKMQHEENLRHSISIMAGKIVHDLRTPLAIMSMEMRLLKKWFPELLQTYETHHADELKNNPRKAENLDYLASSLETVSTQIVSVDAYITLTLKMLSKIVSGMKLDKEDLEVCYAHNVITDAIAKYPFKDEQKALVHFDKHKGNDFCFLGNPTLIIHSFFNLIKNSLEQIAKTKKGEIYLHTEENDNQNIICFKDTAGGAAPDIVAHIFDGYETTKKGGTGIGLSSCKMLMHSFGGDMMCRSVEGDYIEFVMMFPKLSETV